MSRKEHWRSRTVPKRHHWVSRRWRGGVKFMSSRIAISIPSNQLNLAAEVGCPEASWFTGAKKVTPPHCNHRYPPVALLYNSYSTPIIYIFLLIPTFRLSTNFLSSSFPILGFGR